MTENIELNSYGINSTNDNIEEYHEINQGAISVQGLLPKVTFENVNEYDFFTQFNAQVEEKGNGKKKTKKKEKSSNLMDLITSELASISVPIAQNVLTLVNYKKNVFLEDVSRRPQRKICHKPGHFMDSEYGSAVKTISKISPIFPRVLDNAIFEDNTIPVQYAEPVSFNDLIRSNDYEMKQTTRFIDIEIKNLKFEHHHQFTLEQVLCAKLVEIYAEYNNNLDYLNDITRDIKIMRETKDNLKQDFLKVNSNKYDIRFDPTLRKYTGKLLQLKDRFMVILKHQKELEHNIISLWSDIVTIREKTNAKSTDYVINISKYLHTDEEFEKQWNEIFNTEFSDLLDKVEYDYVCNYIEYKESKNDENLDELAKKKLTRPKLEINEEILKMQAIDIVNKTFLKETTKIDLRCDGTLLLKKTNPTNNYYFEIYVDDIFVCNSEYYTSNNDTFEIELNETFSIEIVPYNKNLVLFLYENGEKISDLKKNLSELKGSFKKLDHCTETFISHNTVDPSIKFVGSGHSIKEIASANKVRLKSSNIFKNTLYTSCNVTMRIGWNNKLGSNDCGNIKSFMQIERKLKRLMHGIDKPNPDVLANIINEIYGKDVVNDEQIVNILRKNCNAEVKNNDRFLVDENSSEFVRLKLLHLRNNGGFSNVENKMIPLHASQMSTEQLNCLQRSKDVDFDIQYFNDKYLEMDKIELQRFVGFKYIESLNKKVLKNLDEHLLRKTRKDVVRERKFSLRGLFSNQSSHTNLVTVPSRDKQQILKESLSKDQEIQVTIFRAFNLLDRTLTTESEDQDHDQDEIAGYKMRSLRPFVRISYHGVAVDTAAAIGCHPFWNQTVKLSTKLDPLASLQINIYDEHKVNISDGYSEDNSMHSKTVHYRIYNKWLGTLQVPLHSVLSSGTLRGTFKITTPPLLLGYEGPATNESTHSLIPEITQLMKKDISFISLSITTKLSNIGGFLGYSQPVPNGEDDYIIKHLNTFVTEFINNYPMRNISLSFIDSCGRNKCVTQYLQPLPLPDYECFPKNPKNRSASSKSSSSKSSGRKGVDTEKNEKDTIYSVYNHAASYESLNKQLNDLINASSRYVSLIPTYEVGESHSITLMGVELLKVLNGSPLDHTLLLASYFINLGIKCWVAIGMGLPRGPSSYVLTKFDINTRRIVLVNDPSYKKGILNKNEHVWFVYDATSGERFELRDVGCPLKTVDYVFDNDNIWVNIQSSQECESMSFDFSRTSDWQPVFNTVIIMKQPTVSDPKLYSAPAEVDKLRQILENKIRGKIQKWRPHVKTIWNRYCSSLLREVLPYWEYWSFNTLNPKPELTQKLKQIMVAYKMFGFPLNMPFVNTKSVLSTVKSTGLHINDDPTVEFGLAVEVYAYPNNVLSVWVFLTSITTI